MANSLIDLKLDVFKNYHYLCVYVMVRKEQS